MRLGKVLTETGLARSGSEATRLIKQGAVTVGGCDPNCTFFDTGKCSCGGWRKVTNPLEEVESGLAVKVGDGNWRMMNRLDVGGAGWDQVKGIAQVPTKLEAVEDALDDKTK
jgi:predicted rRNA methylase YqxC with S4 and FtsJ domains